MKEVAAKTIQDLINYLETQDKSLPILMVYDGYPGPINIFKDAGFLCFSHADHTMDYQPANVEFKSKED